MNAVLGLSRLLTTTALSLEQQQYVSMIANSGQLLLTIINDILDYSSDNIACTRWRVQVLLDTRLMSFVCVAACLVSPSAAKSRLGSCR